MQTLDLLPDTGDYNFKPSQTTLRVQHDGPSGRYSTLVPNPTARIPATWSLSEEDLATFCSFFRFHAEAQKPFLVKLFTKRAELRDCVAFFDSDSFSLTAIAGTTFKISCNLQVAEV